MIKRGLFLTERFCDANPACGPTNADSMLVDAIISTGLVGETKRFYFDTLAKAVGREQMRRLLVEDCQIFRPELVLYTPMGGQLGLEINPIDGWVPGSAELLAELHALGIKVYTHLWDTIGREQETRKRHIECSDFCGDVASNADRFQDPRMLQAYSAVDPGVFKDEGLARDIDACFVGSVDPSGQRWPQRIVDINFLKTNGINVVVGGGQRQARLSWQDYAGTLKRAKISLNWSRNGDISGFSQIKGRVFESMACGAMLLEDDGDQTHRFFERGRDFIVFTSQADLLDKVRYYLAHEDERLVIARSGHHKLETVYDAWHVWASLFRQMGY